MNVYGHAQTTSLVRDEAEQIVLERLVVGVRRLAARGITCVDSRGVLSRRLGEIQAPKIRGLELHGHTAGATLRLECRCDNSLEVGVERWWNPCEVEVGQIASEQ